MVAKELNAAVADEKLREQWLKRILPALAITVIYFVFISSTLTEKATKAEDTYSLMMGKGISEAVIPGMEQQNSRLQDELIRLRKKDQELQAGLSAKAGFLYGENDMNEAISRLADLMQLHHLRVTDEKPLGDKKIAELPKSYADLGTWLSSMLQMGETVRVHQIKFIGGYIDTYEALKELASGNVGAIPLSLDMQDPTASQDKQIGLKAWTLNLWI